MARINKIWSDKSTVVLPERSALISALVRASSTDTDPQKVVVISPKAGSDDAGADGAQEIFLGYGDAKQAKFSATREVVQDANVVFITSAHMHNLAGLAHLMRRKDRPVIAVLRNKSTFGHKIVEMMQAIEGTTSLETLNVVVADTPADLIQAVEDRFKALNAPKPWERFKSDESDSREELYKARDKLGLD